MRLHFPSDTIPRSTVSNVGDIVTFSGFPRRRTLLDWLLRRPVGLVEHKVVTVNEAGAWFKSLPDPWYLRAWDVLSAWPMSLAVTCGLILVVTAVLVQWLPL